MVSPIYTINFFDKLITSRCLRRALDGKVRKLRTLLSADEDITSELDRVVCRLMKLALHTSKDRQTPVPASWMQCKLYDLLALTEKAIERRKKYFLEEYTLKAIEYDKDVNENKCILALTNDEEDIKKTDQIMYEYRHLLQPLDEDKCDLDTESQVKMELEEENDFFKDATYEASIVKTIPKVNESYVQKTKLEIVREWVDDEYGSSPYNEYINNEGDTNDSVPNRIHNFEKKPNLDIESSSRSSRASYKKIKSDSNNIISHRSEMKVAKKISRKKLNFSILLKNYFTKNSLEIKNKKKSKGNKKIQPAAAIAAPIPDSLFELRQSNATNANQIGDENYETNQIFCNEYNSHHTQGCDSKNIECENVAAPENTYVISIVTHDAEEQVVLRRSIGTEPDANIVDQDAIIEHVINVTNQNSLNLLKANENEDLNPQTIFLYDINEPSTSKGIRRTGLDVQCGPDDMPNCAVLSATTSFTKLPKLFSKGIKIGQSRTNVHRKITFDMGTSPDCPASSHKSPCNKYPGIWINDSNLKQTEYDKVESFTMTPYDTKEVVCSEIVYDNFDSKNEVTLLRPEPSHTTDDSGSDPGWSIGKTQMRSAPTYTSHSKNTSSVQIQSCLSNGDRQNLSPSSQVKPKLKCGGIYVHSFRDREVSEDVVFQGGWNDINPSTFVKKNSRKAPSRKVGLASKKLKRNSNTSVKNNLIKTETNNATIRPIQIRTAKQSNVKKEQANKNIPSKKPVLTLKNKNNKLNKNIKKVPSKNAFSVIPKNAKIVKERQLSPNPLGKKEVSFEKPNIQNYLPSYLKRKICRSGVVKNILSKSVDSAQPLSNNTPVLMRSNTEEIKRSTFKDNPGMYVSYQVFRNEIENKNYDDNVAPVNYKDVGSDCVHRRSSSPASQHSSCSTPNSIATIRAISSTSKAEPNKKYPSPPNKSGITDSTITAFGSAFGSKIKNIRKSKTGKRNENKENIPTTKAWKNANNEIVGSSIEKSNIISLNLSNTKIISKKSTLKLPNIKSSHSLALKSSTSVLPKKAPRDDESSTKKGFIKSSPSDTLIILEPHKDEALKGVDEFSQSPKFENGENNKVVNEITTHCGESYCSQSESVDSNLGEAIKELFEENVYVITSTPKSTCDYLNSDAVGFYNAETENNSLNISSPTSFNTVIENENSCDFKNDLKQALSNYFNSDQNFVEAVNSNATINLTEYSRTVDLASFGSMCSSSKHSEYFLADNHDVFESINNEASVGSVQGLFERKDHNRVTNVSGPVALQAFSGFSMNVVPLAGDQPEYIMLVDPETGSLRQKVNRQATSEEILVSGRSSDTYESCYVEEDSFVPSWLFNIISQQQSIAESEEDEEDGEDRMPLPIPIVEPILDVNGNIADPGVGAGAGAGDGRGIHSDRSQDSSGRGTSLSSSDTSSGAHSEAILIDPIAYVAQFEFAPETSDDANVDRPSESPDTSFATAEADNGYDNRPRLTSRNMASDIDADVSSLDTDVVDSDT